MDEESIFAAAVEQPSPAECAEFLDRACLGDVNLRARVERLLEAYRRPDPFLEAPGTRLIANVTQVLVRESVGSTIGPYKLIEQIGEGGMGLVFLAQQQKPLRRMVALKIIKPGMDSQQVIRRFESERQTLALMEHPHIAKVLDVGTTDSGRPYFVMELVRGIAITDYCDQAKLKQRERLELFISVCHAVQHAHQKGIIHRDLKPANVLVTMHDDVAIPKVIDFGVAKAIDRSATDQTLVTNFAQMIGTPTYMSPEQAQMSCLDVDTRSDVYSLGVLLYELLTGTTPYEKQRLRGAGYDEMRRILCDEEPPRPSTRVATLEAGSLSTTAGNRRVDPRRFSQALRGDLDWIVMKALEKDRTRRYESASALAADVRRFLADEPVEARPPTPVYRVQKFVRRNRRFAAFAALLMGFLLVSSAGLLVTNVLISRERGKLKEQRDLAQEGEAKIAEREATIRRFLYAADMRLAWAAYNMGDGKQAREKLLAHLPAAGAVDNRGFEWHYLSRLCTDESRMLAGQSRDVFGLAFSPDGARLAATGADRTVVVWNVREGTPHLTLREFTDDVNAADFSRDGKLLATADETGTVRIWNVQTGSEVARLSGFEYPVGKAFFTADDRSLVCTEVDWETHRAHLSTWDLESRERRKIVHGVHMLAVDPRRKIAAAVSDEREGDLTLWAIPELEQLTGWKAHATDVLCAAFSPDGETLATGCRNGEVGLWKPANESGRKLNADQSQAVRSVVFSRDGRWFVAVGDDGAARIWDPQNRSLQKVLPGAHGRMWSAAVSPNGATLAIGCGDGSVELRDSSAMLLPQRRIHSSPANYSGAALDLTGRRLAVIDADGRTASILDAETGQRLRQLEVPVGENATAVAIAAEQRSVWIGTAQGVVRKFDLETGEAQGWPQFHVSWIQSLHVAPSGRFAASNAAPGDERTSFIWDMSSSRRILTLKDSWNAGKRLNTVRQISGESLAVTVQNDTVVLWNFETGREMSPRFPHDSWIVDAAVSPDRKTLAVATEDRAIHLWDIESGRERATLRGHRGPQLVIAFSPDGRTLASAGDDGELKLWHLPTSQFLCDVTHLTGIFRFLAFTRDGKRLVGIVENHITKTEGTSEVIVWNGALRMPQ